MIRRISFSNANFRLNIRVIPKASRNFIVKENDVFKVHLTKPAQDGLANKQLIDLLSEFLKVGKNQIRIIKGHKSRNKLVEINGDNKIALRRCHLGF